MYILVYMNLEEILKEARSEKIPVMLDDGIVFLCDFIKSHEQIHRILEIGTAVGYSAMQMALLRDDIQIDTLEINAELAEKAKHNIMDNDLEDRIHVYLTDAMDYQTDRIYDMIFVDAAKAQYIHYMPEVLRLLKAGGTLVSDNVLQDGEIIESRFAVERRNRTIHGRMREYLYELKHHEDLITSILPLGDGVAVSTKKEKKDGKKTEDKADRR